ncbi:MAG TPA: hypothetical protein VM735_00635 [Candidatus Kapabacteria bacterium]|nr:hypothetical protein [Candidatus Kapabacteria bacterium]
MELPQRFTYNPQWRTVVAGALFFGVISVFMGYKAIHNTAGIIINGILELGPTGATTFYWIICAGGAGFVLLGALITIRRVASTRFSVRL